MRSLKGVLNDILMVSGQTSGMTRLRDNQPCQETFRQECFGAEKEEAVKHMADKFGAEYADTERVAREIYMTK